MMEGTLLLATIAQRYQLDLLPGARVEPEASVTLRPGGMVPMMVRDRGSVADGRRARPEESPS